MVEKTDYVFDTDASYINHLTYHEWHLIWNGFYIGLISYPEHREMAEEPDRHYWRYGVLAGLLLKLCLLLGVATKVRSEVLPE